MNDLPLSEVRRLVAAANAARWGLAPGDATGTEDGSAEHQLDVPVFSAEGGPGHVGERRLCAVANLYAATEASAGGATP